MAKSGLTLLSATASRIEAILFVASTQVSEKELAETLAVPTREVTAALSELRGHLVKHAHGIELQNAAGGWQLVTQPHYAEVLSLFRDITERQRVRLSKASVETLAIIAYNQPVTRGEVDEIRSVRSASVIETLLGHGLVKIAGRKKSVGSPLLYRTTSRFLEIFGLSSVSELPSLEELTASDAVGDAAVGDSAAGDAASPNGGGRGEDINGSGNGNENDGAGGEDYEA